MFSVRAFVRLIGVPGEAGWNWRDVAGVVEQLPSLQREGQIAVEPDEVVEGLEFEGIALLAAGESEKSMRIMSSLPI